MGQQSADFGCRQEIMLGILFGWSVGRVVWSTMGEHRRQPRLGRDWGECARYIVSDARSNYICMSSPFKVGTLNATLVLGILHHHATVSIKYSSLTPNAWRRGQYRQCSQLTNEPRFY